MQVCVLGLGWVPQVWYQRAAAPALPDEAVDVDLAGLPDAVAPVLRLCIHRRVPVCGSGGHVGERTGLGLGETGWQVGCWGLRQGGERPAAALMPGGGRL